MRHNLSSRSFLAAIGVAMGATGLFTIAVLDANRSEFAGRQASALSGSATVPCLPGSARCPNEQAQEADQLRRIHAVLVSAQMVGDARAAIAASETLWRLAVQEPLRGSLLAQRMMAARYFVHTQFDAPQTVLAIPAPGEGFPYAQAMWHYARGVARAASGDAPGAQQDVEAIMLIQLAGDFTKLNAGTAPAKDAVRIARHVLQARIAQARGEASAAIVALEWAAAIEDTLANAQALYWYVPVRQSLGAALLNAGYLDRAEQAFRTCLDRNPENGWALFGLAQLCQRRGFVHAAEAAQTRLAKVWAGSLNQFDLARL